MFEFSMNGLSMGDIFLHYCKYGFRKTPSGEGRHREDIL
jgi:hypothetical protein